MSRHRRIQDGGNPAQGPTADEIEDGEETVASDVDEFPDTPDDNAADPKPGAD